MQGAGVRLGLIALEVPLLGVLLEGVVVAVVVEQRLEIEDAAALSKVLVERKGILADAFERVQPLVDAILQVERHATMRLELRQRRGPALAELAQQRRDDGFAVIVRQLHAILKLLFGRPDEELRPSDHDGTAQFGRPPVEAGGRFGAGCGNHEVILSWPVQPHARRTWS